jgi:catechol 2,3-dioxygenase-like lactoylglutathione lyase family enzyme
VTERISVIRGIDHIVIPVHDLATAIADYSALGFTVVRGGRHPGLNTHNALIAFDDGCYFELIASLEPGTATHWWFDGLRRDGGFTDFCLQSDQLVEDSAAFRRAGAAIGTPFMMSRERPDGYRLDWELAVNESDTRGLVPFFIRDITPRDERVPRGPKHSNRAAGVESLAIVVAEMNSVQPIYEVALEQSGKPIERDDLQAAGVRFALGPHELQLITPRDSLGPAAEQLRRRGPSPFAVKLRGGADHGVLDITRTHGARISLGCRTRL